MRRIHSLILCLILCTACGGGTSSSSGKSENATVSLSIPSQLVLRQLAIDIKKVHLVVESDGENLIDELFDISDFDPASDNATAITIDVPVGSNRVFMIDAYDPDTGEGFRGEETDDVPEAGGTISIDTHFLNFAVDAEGDQVDPIINVPVSDQENVFPAIITVLTPVQFTGWDLIRFNLALPDNGNANFLLQFSDPITVNPLYGFIVFNTDLDDTSGNTDFWTDLLGDDITADVRGVERYIEFYYDPNTPTSTVNLYNGDATTYPTPLGETATQALDGNATTFTISLSQGLATDFLNTHGYMNIVVGFKDPSTELLIPTDVILGSGLLEYDLNGF